MDVPPWITRLSARTNLSPRMTRELFTFALHSLSGIVVVAAHYVTMWILIQLSTPALAATSAGFIAGAATRFYLSYHHVFDPQATVPRASARFLVALGIQFLLNGAIFALLTYLTVPTWPAQVLTSASLVLLNYLMYRIWVFS